MEQKHESIITLKEENTFSKVEFIISIDPAVADKQLFNMSF